MTKQAQGHFRAVTSSPQDLAQLEAIITQLRLKSNLRMHWKFSGFTSDSNFKNCTLVAS